MEPYIRRAIAKMGWEDLSDKKEAHVKFDVLDIEQIKKERQFYNHFPDNRQITTKAGLCRNMQQTSLE